MVQITNFVKCGFFQNKVALIYWTLKMPPFFTIMHAVKLTKTLRNPHLSEV